MDGEVNAAGIDCQEMRYGDVGDGMVFVADRDVPEVLALFGTRGSFAVHMKGRGRPAFGIHPETRVVVVRVIQRATVRSAGGSKACE
jgi:hypothetical protein